MEYNYLNKIKSPADVKKLSESELVILCKEIRDCLINTVSKNGGHLASNLGAVELTVALHRCFDSPHDSILFDVGHQSYTHKLLTGRFDKFDTIRKKDGLSGFMRPGESQHDPFVTGHSSNSVSASYGIYKAKTLLHDEGYAVSVVGDGAMTGGMIYEALNNAGSGRGNFIVVLNDNKMSISRNVGAFSRYLTKIRSKASYHRIKRNLKNFIKHIPIVGNSIAGRIFNSKTMLKNAIYDSNIFEGMGFNYLGPVDGHDIKSLENIFNIAKNEYRPCLVHVLTTKGKGYSFAEEKPKNYHGVSAFDVSVGVCPSDKKSFSDVFGDTLSQMAAVDEKVCAVTAAMTSGTGLSAFAKQFKNRFFDVGIAEEHAATFSAGLAIKGMKPYFAVYSSFLQRSYDQIIHDIAIANIPVRLCVDRAGVVGEDGESHQGLFDAAYLSTVPNMVVYSPCYYNELEYILRKSLTFDFPSAIRYPRGCENTEFDFYPSDDDFSVYGDGNIVVLTYGRIFVQAIKAQNILEKKGINVKVIKLNKIHPIDKAVCDELRNKEKIYFFEEGIKNGGIAEQLAAIMLENGVFTDYKIVAVDNKFVTAATTADSLKYLKLDCESIEEIITEEFNG